MIEATSRPILVKRFARQRLYEATSLRYVSIDELRAWDAAELAFCVIDTETGEDVTRILLA